MKIGIIGGGAAGLVVAIEASCKKNEVIILEKNSECGKKILATGNGRCNYWNEDQNICHYESSNQDLIEKFITLENNQLVISFFEKLGIIPKIKNGYYYPNSNQAITIRDALVAECLDRKVKIKCNYQVNTIKKINDKFKINDEEIFDKLIIATGGYAKGLDSFGYKFLKDLGHTVIKPRPALVQLNTKKYPYLNKWKGIRCEVNLNLKEDDRIIKSQSGEIQLTDYGISGICVFNLSNEIGKGLLKGKKEVVEIDFLPNIDLEKYLNSNNKSIGRLLSNILNNKLVETLLNYKNISSSALSNTLDKNTKEEVIKTFKKFNVEIESTKSFQDAQVCAGGVILKEINLNTMESSIVPNLYIVGELIDLTGECGGYNLGIAWRSGILAGRSIRGEDNA